MSASVPIQSASIPDWINKSFSPPDFSRFTPEPVTAEQTRFKLFKISEISAGEAAHHRLAMGNVLASLNKAHSRLIYLVSGTPEGVEFYLGVATEKRNDDELHELAKMLHHAFCGNFLGANLEPLREGDPRLDRVCSETKYQGIATGVPSFNEESGQIEEDFQGIERLVNSMLGETWQLVIVAEPSSEKENRNTLDRLYDLATKISLYQKDQVQRSENISIGHSEADQTSHSTTTGDNRSQTLGKNEGASNTLGSGTSESSGESHSSSGRSTNQSQTKNWGTNESVTTGTSRSDTQGSSKSTTASVNRTEGIAYTRERSNKIAEELHKHIGEQLIPRFQQGLSKGMFRTALYLRANHKATYDRLKSSVLSIFQGNQPTLTPLRVQEVSPTLSPLRLNALRIPPDAGLINELAQSIPHDPARRTVWQATWLTARELTLIAGLPAKELPGLKVRKSVEFALNTPADGLGNDAVIQLGNIVQHGRPLEYKQVRLIKDDLNKHVFISGVTGAGKTTTCMKLLVDSGLPFLVIEPAKTEYRALHALCPDLETYVLGREDLTPFRLNPFELVSLQENLAGHIDLLKATLTAVFPMEASMPYIVAEAIINAYKNKGWDIHSGENFFYEDPWASDAQAWPTFAEMIAELDGVIRSAGMGKEFEEKYRGSLVSRLKDLTVGTKGRMINTRRSLDFNQLLDKHVVIELDEIKDEQDKALFMALILQRLAETVKHRHARDKNFRHLTLVEEAHRLLARPEPGESDAKKQGVETFANLLAEVRKYNEGLIIADQIPNKLVPDVIKNTHTKIVHRLFAADDRNTIGDAMGLSDEQKDFLPLLQPGEAVVYCGGWHAAVRVKVNANTDTSRDEIGENSIRAKGRKLLWEQRERLYPRLSAHPAASDIDRLNLLTEKGIPLINAMLSAFYSQRTATSDQKKVEEEKRHKIQHHFAARFADLKARTGLGDSELASALTALFFDVSGYTKSQATMHLMEKILAEAITALGQDLEAFHGIVDSREGKAIFDGEIARNGILSL